MSSIARAGLAVILLAVTGGPSGAAAPTAVLPEPTWRACPGEPQIGCAELVVPLDHDDPARGAIRLPVRRLAANDPSERIGVLVTIAGGPGQRGTDLVDPDRYPASIRARFDIVGWDPRGTSGETLVDCIPEWDPFGDLDRTPDTPTERATLQRTIADLVDRCRGRHGRMLPFLGTRETVLDLETLRLWLDQGSISLHGTSYGSKVATVYASRFPDRVRAALLDGYADPNQTPAERDVEQAAAFERELDRLLEACAAQPACALARDDHPATALDTLLERLDAEPLPAAGGRVLTEADAYEAIASALVRDRRARERLLTAIAAAAAGDGSALLAMADSSRDAFTRSGLTLGVFAAITCADDAAFWRSLGPDGIAAHVDRIHAAASRLGPWFLPPPTPAGRPAAGLCAMQPEAAGLPHAGFDAAGAGPILVLSTTGDPTTPLSAARRALDDLEDVALLEVAADHHTVYGHAVADPARPYARCVVDAVERFLVELVVPARACLVGSGGRGADQWRRPSDT